MQVRRREGEGAGGGLWVVFFHFSFCVYVAALTSEGIWVDSADDDDDDDVKDARTIRNKKRTRLNDSLFYFVPDA